jgi:hypothetical protein
MQERFEQRQSVLTEGLGQQQIYAVSVLLDPIADISFIDTDGSDLCWVFQD